MWPARLHCPWDSPGKSTGVDFHSLLQRIFLTRDRTWVSCISGKFFTIWVTGKIIYGSVQFSSVQSLSRVQLFATPWSVAHQAPLSMEFSRQEYWSGLPFPSPEESSQPRDWTQVSYTSGRFFTAWDTREYVSLWLIPVVVQQKPANIVKQVSSN